MKTNLLPLSCFFYLVCCHCVSAQKWVPQAFDMLPEDYLTWVISAVGDHTVYTCNSDLFGQNALLLKTTDGGSSWSTIDLSEYDIVKNIHALSEDSIWMVSESSDTTTLYLSIDGGNTWENKYSYPGLNVIGPAMKFTSSGNGFLIEPFSLTSHYSIDGGSSWNQVFMPSFQSGETWGMASPSNWLETKGDTLWWGTSQNIRRSMDGGQSWENISSDFNGIAEISSVAFDDFGNGLAISSRFGSNIQEDLAYVQSSQDWGDTWNFPGLPKPDYHLENVAAIPELENTFVVGGGILKEFLADLSPIYGCLYTTDGGQSWTTIDSIPLNGIDFGTSQTGWAGRIASFDYEGNPAIFKWEWIASNQTKLEKITASISPNPFSHELRISLSESKKGTALLKNMEGVTVYRRNFQDQHFQINNFGELPPGVYILELNGERFWSAQKVIKI